MAVKKHENQNSKALAQGNADIDGDILGPFMPSLPLIEGENEADYQSFRESCLREIKPKDIVEIVLLQDFIDYRWEAKRFKRMKAALIEAEKRKAVENLIRDYADANLANEARSLSKEWSRGEQETVEFVEDLLAEHGLSNATVMAKAVEGCLGTLEPLDKLIGFYDYRRDAALRELEKRRDLLAKRARDFGETMITDVEPDGPQEFDEGLSAIPASLGR